MLRIGSQIINLFFPARCPICNEIGQRQLHLCEKCETDTERITERCIGCGRPKTSCQCSRNNFSLCLAAPFVYKDKVREAIHRFKFNGETDLAEFFGTEISKCVTDEFGNIEFDIVTCVPQTKRKRRKRGYNQSALLAKQVAKKLSLPYDELLLIKTRETADQHDLRGKERLKNLKNAFAAENSQAIKGKTILICDDIKTTGATLHECRKTLLKAGAEAVCCAAIAVTPEKII
ncbi:MAG: ComF family protein [Clostridia bacterium]|nr:ComF family protein [Clostridia bacterium]